MAAISGGAGYLADPESTDDDGSYSFNQAGDAIPEPGPNRYSLPPVPGGGAARPRAASWQSTPPKVPSNQQQPTPTPKIPLMERRKIQLPPRMVDSPEVMRFSSSESVPEYLRPLDVMPLSVVGVRKPFPGAFATRRSLIFFDWDDTLCPTSAIQQLLNDHMEEKAQWVASDERSDRDWRYEIPAWFGQPLPDMPHVRESIDELQRAVIDVINTAQALGVVCIVTNSVSGWVETTTNKWLPRLKQYIHGAGARPPIEVLYGQRELHGEWGEQGNWADGLGRLARWKKAAMLSALDRVDDLYRVRDAPHVDGGAPPCIARPRPQSGSSGLVSILSIGDSEAELHAAWHTAYAALGSLEPRSAGRRRRRRPLSAPPGPNSLQRPWIKTVKFEESPTVAQIVRQLDHLKKRLPELVAAREHLHFEPEALATGAPASSMAPLPRSAPMADGAAPGAGAGPRQVRPPMAADEVEAVVRQRLRTQSV